MRYNTVMCKSTVKIRRSHMDKNTRICIVGGGPAGVSAGMYLEQKG